MKRLLIILGIASFSFVSCSQHEDLETALEVEPENESVEGAATPQEVRMYYRLEYTISPPPSLADPSTLVGQDLVQPNDLYDLVLEEIRYKYDKTQIINKYYAAGMMPYTPVVCNLKDFETTIQREDLRVKNIQKEEAKNFEKFIKDKIEPLLAEKEKYGKGEFTIKVGPRIFRKEQQQGIYFQKFDGRGNLLEERSYEPYGVINNIPVTQEIGEPIIFEIKYKYPE